MAVFNFTVRATDSEGSYADRQFNITVRNSKVERFMVVDANDAWTSPDGNIWTQRSAQGGVTCEYGNGFWLIKTNAGSFNFRKSTDGINYNLIQSSAMTFLESDGSPATVGTPHSSTSYGIDQRSKLKFWNGRFWILATNSMSYDLWSSADGITWRRKNLWSSSTNSSLPNANTLPWIEMSIDGDSLFIPMVIANITAAGAGSPYTQSGPGWSTSDGVTFTQYRNIASSNAGYGGCTHLMRVNGLFIAKGHAPTGAALNSDYYYSTDGLNWTSVTFPTQTGHNPTASIFYANGRLYQFCQRSSAGADRYFTSVDGTTWTVATGFKGFLSTNSDRNQKAMFKNGVFVVMCSSGSATSNDDPADMGTYNNGFRISLDGNTWTLANGRNGTVTTYLDMAAM